MKENVQKTVRPGNIGTVDGTLILKEASDAPIAKHFQPTMNVVSLGCLFLTLIVYSLK